MDGIALPDDQPVTVLLTFRVECITNGLEVRDHPRNEFFRADLVAHVRIAATGQREVRGKARRCTNTWITTATIYHVVKGSEWGPGQTIAFAPTRRFDPGAEFLIFLNKFDVPERLFDAFSAEIVDGRVDIKLLGASGESSIEEALSFLRDLDSNGPAPLGSLQFKTGWIVAGGLAAPAFEAWEHEATFEYVETRPTERVVPRAGDRIRLKSGSWVSIEDFDTKGETLRLIPPRNGGWYHDTNTYVRAGETYDVADVAITDQGLVWIRLVPLPE